MPFKAPVTSYEDARKASRSIRGVPDKVQKPRGSRQRKEEKPDKPGNTVQADKQKSIPPKFASVSGKKVMLSLSVPHPAPGVSPSFDEISKFHGGNTAMKTVLKRAIPLFEKRIKENTLSGIDVQYSLGDGITQTTRMMDVALVEAASKYFDPLGVLSRRGLALKIAQAALSLWFKQEAK